MQHQHPILKSYYLGNKKQNINLVQKIEFIRKIYHSDDYFSAFTKFYKKLTFLTPDTQTYVCVSGGKKC